MNVVGIGMNSKIILKVSLKKSVCQFLADFKSLFGSDFSGGKALDKMMTKHLVPSRSLNGSYVLKFFSAYIRIIVTVKRCD